MKYTYHVTLEKRSWTNVEKDIEIKKWVSLSEPEKSKEKEAAWTALSIKEKKAQRIFKVKANDEQHAFMKIYNKIQNLLDEYDIRYVDKEPDITATDRLREFVDTKVAERFSAELDIEDEDAEGENTGQKKF
jgi:hypothetical protein